MSRSRSSQPISSSSGSTSSGPGSRRRELELDEQGRDDQELRQGLQVDRLPGGHFGHEGVDHRGQGDVEDLHLVVVDQLQEEVDGALEGGGGHVGGHAIRRYRLGTTISCTVLAQRPGPHPGPTYDDPPCPAFSPVCSPAVNSHVGNYLGAIRNWVADQYVHDALYCIVDLHALTLDIDPDALRARTFETALDLLAAGLDPERCTLFVQSHVSEHAQLAWLLECTATMGELRRMTQFKEKSAGKDSVRVGLFTYPVLQSADILLYDADRVPVGDDQRQHLELARQLALRFNHRLGPTFVVPEAAIPATAARVMDLQHPENKMSKSVNSPLGTVLLLDQPADIERKVKRAVTDTDGEVRYDPGTKPGVSNLLELLAVSTDRSPAEVAASYQRYGDLKTRRGRGADRIAPSGPGAPGRPGRRPRRGDRPPGQGSRQGPDHRLGHLPAGRDWPSGSSARAELDGPLVRPGAAPSAPAPAPSHLEDGPQDQSRTLPTADTISPTAVDRGA